MNETINLNEPSSMDAQSKIGLISGFGPLAGADVLKRILEYSARQYSAFEDHEYPSVVLQSQGFDGFGDSAELSNGFQEALVELATQVTSGGASIIGVACNTAHLYLPEIQASASRAVVVNLIEEVALKAAGIPKRYLLLTSQSTKDEGLHSQRLKQHGVDFCETTIEQQERINEVINAVMQFDLDLAAETLRTVIIDSQPLRIEGLILGCTELPIAYQALAKEIDLPVIDSNQVLAEALTDRYYEN